MAVEFVLEDGTGKTDSTSYAAVADFRQYFENFGTTFTETDDEIKTWLKLMLINFSSQYLCPQ